MRDLLSVLFYVRKSKKTNVTHTTVYARITYDGKRAEMGTMFKVPIVKWNAKANKEGGSSIEAKKINRNLDIIRNRIHEIYHKLVERKEEISAVKLKDEYLGNNNTHKHIIEMFDEHNGRMEKLIGKDFSFRTLQRYKITKKPCQLSYLPPTKGMIIL